MSYAKLKILPPFVRHLHLWKDLIFEKENEAGYCIINHYLKCKECGLTALLDKGSNAPFLLAKHSDYAILTCNEIQVKNILY